MSMIRTPLRPLAKIMRAREQGQDPNQIEQDNYRRRQQADAAYVRRQEKSNIRLFTVGLGFLIAFTAICGRMGVLATQTDIDEPRVAGSGQPIISQRADIVDRNGRILATNFETHSLYAQPQEMVDPKTTAKALVEIFPQMDEARLVKDFTGARKFVWLRRKMSPEQMQLVHDIGSPGLLFGPREMRLYPNGSLAAHVLGGASFGREGVSSAEVIGVSGVELQFDEALRNPENQGAPLQLSLDLTVQSAAQDVLLGGMTLMNAKGATAVLMDVKTGEIISLVSLPDFDPNNRPLPLAQGDPSDSPLFNRAVQGRYELGSVFKIFTTAQAMEHGLVQANSVIDIRGPLRWGRHKIRDFHNYGKELSVTNIIVKSSNIGTARLAQSIGIERQKAFFSKLGLLSPTSLEVPSAKHTAPLLSKQWSELTTMTASYGHGISVSPVHLAAGYASLLNGGTAVRPTLLKQNEHQHGPRVVSEATSAAARDMLRQVVTRGTASLGDVPGYEVGGKTGTADKPLRRGGGYADDKVIATFASVFPAGDPKYVLIVTLDEPVETSGDKPRRTAGWTAVPVAAEMIRRVAPLLGLRPQEQSLEPTGVTLTSY